MVTELLCHRWCLKLQTDRTQRRFFSRSRQRRRWRLGGGDRRKGRSGNVVRQTSLFLFFFVVFLKSYAREDS